MQIDIVNGNNEKVGAVELNDELFGGRVKAGSDLGSGRAGERLRAPRHARDEEPRGSSAAAARSRGGRRAPAGRGSARSATRCGARAAPCSARSRAATPTTCRRRCAAARSRAALAQKLSDGAVIVVDRLEASDRKTKTTAQMLKRLGATGKTLVIDVKPDEGFALSARNIAGVKLVASNRVTARDVIDTSHVIATQGALEKLQEALG